MTRRPLGSTSISTKEQTARRRELGIEVSYTTIDNIQEEELSIVLQKVATAINVQLTLPDGGTIPFVPFNEFTNATHEDKVYLYGASGSGKSRSMYEILKSKALSSKRIFVINPRNRITDKSTESGRVDIYELIDKFTDNDVIVWDNFPDDLEKKDIDSGRKALEIVSSKNVKNLLVALKPKYLESYRNVAVNILELYEHRVQYNKEKVRDIVKFLGTNTRFRQMYEKYIAKELDRISKILWEKEPTPLTVLDYYKELSNKESQGQGHGQHSLPLNPILEAQNLARNIEYYEHQFRYISNSEERHGDAEFLYTLKLCYEIGYARTVNSIEELQKGIFHSNPPKEAARKLDRWAYLSGPYYSMHDAARQSIKFDDYAKMQIMTYLTDDFTKVIPKEDDQVYSFAIFFGKHFEFVPRTSFNQFLPSHIYEYMKKIRYFENCLGQGVGESFSFLDEELQATILKRLEVDIEFSHGLGIGLGQSFPYLDKTNRDTVLKKIYSGIPFAMLFGQSLGRMIKYLPQDAFDEVFQQIIKNAMFAFGVGRGLGYVYESLDEKQRKEILAIAENNSEISNGIGLGLGQNFLALSKPFQNKIVDEMREKNHMFDQGLGMGLGLAFRDLSEGDRDAIFRKGEKSVQFVFGFGIGLGQIFTFLSEDLKKELLQRAENDGEFAKGLAAGCSYGFIYLAPEYQKKLFELIQRNKEFAYGLGMGFGFNFGFLPKEIKDGTLARADENIEFDQGLGFGVGIGFVYLSEHLQEEMFKRAEDDPEFAYGLGHTLGYTSPYYDDLRLNVLKRAEKNKDLMRGLGSGAALCFGYQTEARQQEILEMMYLDGEFAIGLGMTMGRLFKYFHAKDKLFERIEDNPLFAYGLGYGLGYNFTYHTEDFQKKIFDRAAKNSELSLGLGHGLGHRFMYFQQDSQKKIFDRAEYDPEFAYGLGYGLGRSLTYLPKQIENEVTSRATNNIQLDIGFGGGIGNIMFRYVAIERQKEILGRESLEVTKETGFVRGLGSGIGHTIKYLDKKQQEEVLRKIEESSQFAIGIGESFGLIYEEDELPEYLSSRMHGSTPLARGYGEGLGLRFKYLDKQKQKMTLERQDIRFSRGLGIGLGRIFKYLDNGTQEHLFRKIDEKSQFAIGLGIGLGRIFKYLDIEEKAQIFKIAQENSQFGKGFAFALSYTFRYLTTEDKGGIFKKVLGHSINSNGNPLLATGLGEGLGRNFLCLSPRLQEELFRRIEDSSEFADGLGNGIGQIFGQLDEVLQISILNLIGRNNEFDIHIGNRLGRNFPSLDQRIQRQILEKIPNDEVENIATTEFVKSFVAGLESSFRYLDQELQREILSQRKLKMSFISNDNI